MGGSVLFVDDQVEITDLIQRMLKDEDYIKYFANSAAEALEIMEKHDINVVVTDMVMPHVSGLQLLSILKDKYPLTVRIVLSGQLQIASVLAAINAGEVYRYITKPWKVDAKSKMTIREALEYSEYLRAKSRSVISDRIEISQHSLNKLMECVGMPYVLVHNTEVVVSQLQGFQKGEQIEELAFSPNQYITIELSDSWNLYLLSC